MLGPRWVSTFTVIGAILIGLGLVGLVMGPRFVYDPGQPVMGKEAWCYLAVGILMVVNGLLTPPTQPEDKATPTKPGKPASNSAARLKTGKAEAARAKEKIEV